MAQRIDDPRRARSLARTIASDIALYNQARLADQPGKDERMKLLEREIEDGRQYLKERVGPDIPADELYDRAIVEALAPGPAKPAPKRRAESVG